jgi:Flp pilus assembly protein TadG
MSLRHILFDTFVRGWAGSRFLRRRFRRSDRGSIAIPFALSILPVLLIAGAAVDYSVVTDAKVRLDAALDTAALTTVAKGMLSRSAASAQTTGISLFNSQAATVKTATINSISLTVTETAMERTTVASYSATVPTSFMGIAGITTVTAPYIDFYLLLDNSPSMGVGATTNDIDRMVAATANKSSDASCAFACHDLSKGNGDYYNLFKSMSPKIQMRIDVVRSATEKLMDTATSMTQLPNEFRMAIYTFGASCGSPGLTTISNLTSSLASAKAAAGNIDLMSTPSQNYNNDQCTDFDGILKGMNTTIPAAGNGTLATPQKILFLVSDGVSDAYYPANCSRATTNGRCQAPINTANCRTLKDRGVQIAVLYTTYLPLPTNSWYNQWIAPFASQINPTMQSCASPGLFFEVSPSQGIEDAMAALFHKTVLQARFTR